MHIQFLARSSSLIVTRTYIRCFSSEDPILTWARENPEKAQLCLQPPVWENVQLCDPRFEQAASSSLEKYLSWRKWPNMEIQGDESLMEVSEADAVIKDKTSRLASHVLSTPLTLANFVSRHALSSNTRIACVGARAEATIPFDIWKEYLLLLSLLTASATIDHTLDFIGPDMVARPGKTPGQRVSIESGDSLLLKWLHRGLFHDFVSADDSRRSMWSALAFFNPGFGHSHLKNSWKPTLDLVINLSHPTLLTAHSEIDAERDRKLLQEEYGIDVDYKENPFASRIMYQDPFEAKHMVQPNHFVAYLHNESDPKRI